MAKSFLTPAGGTNTATAGAVVPFDANEWIPTEVNGEIMQALQKASVIERVARRAIMTTDAQFEPRDHGTGIDSPRIVGFFPDTTGGDEVLLRPSVFGTQIPFERFDLDDTKPNPIPPKVQAWIRAAARATDRMSLSTNPNVDRTTANATNVGGSWDSIASGSTSTVIKPETHVPACSVFATLAIGRSEDLVLSPYSSTDTVGDPEDGRTPLDWNRPAGASAVAPEYQFRPGMTFGNVRPVADGAPVHCCTSKDLLTKITGGAGSAGYDLFSATKGILEDGYFFAEGEMVWVVPYAAKDLIRRIKDENGLPILGTVAGEPDSILGDQVLYTPGGKLSRPGTSTESPKANVAYADDSDPGTAPPAPAGGAAASAFNPATNGGYLSPTTYSTGAASKNLPAPGKAVGLMMLYCHPAHLILGLRSGPEYMASRFNAESKFNKDFLKMQMRRGFSVGFPMAMSALVIVPGSETATAGSALGDAVNPVTGVAFTRNVA